MTEPLTIRLKTLTPLWTGGVDQTCDRLHETGLIGSLRWWYEALVRGIGGYACDPTDDSRCPDNNGKHCVACELFGCTGWARKFRLQVLDEKQNIRESALLNANTNFTLHFIELRPFKAEERWLLTKTVEIAAKYGALGGKTTLKPQKRPKVGDDYGIVHVEGSQNALQIPKLNTEQYLRSGQWCNSQVKEPDLRWFFFVQNAFLWRRQINSLMGLSENGRSSVSHEASQRFVRGKRGDQNSPAVSKKIFSSCANGGRIWGYARDQKMMNEIVKKVKEQLGAGSYLVKTGEQVLHEL
ncbi:MAG: type III-B CRISPR module RAMP protein Cmr1 [Candidatus Binatia bacterium]